MEDLWKVSYRPLEDLWKTCGRSLEEEKKVSGRFFRSYEWTYTDESFYVTSWCGIQQWSFGCRDEPCAKYVRAHRAPCDIWPCEANWCEWTWCRSITRLWRSLETWTTRKPWFEFCTCFFCNSFSFESRWKWKYIWNLADRAVCHSEHSSEYCDFWNATWFFGCQWTVCQWSSCATCSIQHGPTGLADDETADAFDSEYDGLYDEVSTEYGTTNVWSTSKQWTGGIFRKCTF